MSDNLVDFAELDRHRRELESMIWDLEKVVQRLQDRIIVLEDEVPEVRETAQATWDKVQELLK